MTRAGFHPNRPVIEIADIFRRHGQGYARAHAARLGRVERRVMVRLRHAGQRARRPCRSLRRRGVADRLRLLSRSSLFPKLPGTGAGEVGRRPPSRSSCRSLFPHRLHLARADRRDRLPDAGCRLCDPVQAAADAMTALAGRSAQVGTRIGGLAILHAWGQRLDPSPARPLRRAGGGSHSMEHDGSRNSRASFSPSNRSPDCSGACFSNACKRFEAGMLGFFNSLTRLADRDTFTASSKPCAASIGWSTPKPFGGPAQVLAYLGR